MEPAFRAAGSAAADLVREGFLITGRTDRQGYFHPWTEGTPEEAAAWVEKRVEEMIKSGEGPYPGAPCWFDLAGKERLKPPADSGTG